MARKKQNITIVGREANKRVQYAIPKLQKQNGFGKRQATAVAIRMESVGQLGMGGAPETAKQVRSGKKSMGVFATAQIMRNRIPKRTMNIPHEPIEASNVAEYARTYRSNVPVMFTANKTKPKKKK
tara:strand:- start:39 stop:416 length:378 start_codon:yes stop_codon:yes gene_type:complete